MDLEKLKFIIAFFFKSVKHIKLHCLRGVASKSAKGVSF